ncbi:hypothetical protein LINPERHAP1_LOCUS25385 [Linum perenne]
MLRHFTLPPFSFLRRLGFSVFSLRRRAKMLLPPVLFSRRPSRDSCLTVPELYSLVDSKHVVLLIVVIDELLDSIHETLLNIDPWFQICSCYSASTFLISKSKHANPCFPFIEQCQVSSSIDISAILQSVLTCFEPVCSFAGLGFKKRIPPAIL